MVCCVLSVITLPFLIGKTKTGRELVLFSQTFKALLCLVIIASYLAFGNALPALIYTILVFLMALVYGYYRMREWEFDPVTIPLGRREIPVPPKKEALAVSTDDKEEPEAVQEVKDTKEEKAEKEEEILEEEVEEKYYISQDKMDRFITSLNNEDALLYDVCQIKREGKAREYKKDTATNSKWYWRRSFIR